MTMLSDKNYINFIQGIKTRIQSAQTKAHLAVNKELIELYWSIGQDILEKQQEFGWGAGVVKDMERDLKLEFPNQTGFSRRNLLYMRKMVEFYSTFKEGLKVQQLAAQIPWATTISLIDKIKTEEATIFYQSKIVEGGWSRSILEIQIESKLFERSDNKDTNFELTLPSVDSDLRRDLVKSSYKVDLLASQGGNKLKERDLQAYLMENLTNFLLQLGKGFAFVGQYYKIHVGKDPDEIDLLFYHLGLRRYVVIELKVVDFVPEFVGKLSYYMVAINEQVKSELDGETIGILICKGKDTMKVQYSLKGTSMPIGVSQLNLTQEERELLPDEEDIEEILNSKDEK